MNRQINEKDLDHSREVDPQVVRGTIGWYGEDEVADIGTGSNEGVTLARVTLHRGAPPGARVTAGGAANGHRVLCQLSWPIWAIPRKGQNCVVAFPDGLTQTPGAGILIAFPGQNPFRQFSADAVMFDFSGYDVVIKGKSVTLISEDEGVRHMVSVSGLGGCQMVDGGGSGCFAKDGEVNIKSVDPDGNLMSSIVVAKDALSFSEAAGGALSFEDGDCTLTGGMISVAFSTALGLGKNASPATPVCLGAIGSAAVGSGCIWGAMTP